ncbi:hypothetical protein QYB59_001388 [Clostridium perfringens]|nr:hypothetical protein [Clostridium perfringens]
MVNRSLGKDFGFYKSHEIQKEGLLEFAVFSDIHIVSDSMEDELSVKWNKAIECVKNDFKNSSGIMVCGDFAEAGEEYQFKTYFDILDKHDKDLEILTAIGNHQVRWKDTWNEPYSLYMKYNKKYMGETEGKIYFDKWIKGYHFIFLNTEWHIKDRAYISEEQLNWLDKTMGEKEEEGKPVFLFLHQALRDTYWNSNEWDVGVQDFALKEVLRKHPNCIMFTGHIHNGLGKLDVLKTEYGIMVDVPGFRSNDYGDSRGEIGYHVSVNEGNVQISLYDYREHKWIKDYNYVVDLDAKFYEKVKILDIDFNNGSLKDKSSYNNKLINIEEEFVPGVYEGQALRIKDFKSLINKGIFDEENLIISPQNSEFTMLFWSKINCEEWHQIAVSKNNESKLKFHMDGELIHKEKKNKNDISLNKAFINGILKSTKLKENEIKELLIDGLKVYKKALGSAELETAYNPFRIKVESNKIIISWNEFIDKEIEPAYIVLNGEEYCKIDLNENSKEIPGLEPNKEYTVIIVDREKNNHRNFRNAYSFVIKTKNLI